MEGRNELRHRLGNGAEVPGELRREHDTQRNSPQTQHSQVHPPPQHSAFCSHQPHRCLGSLIASKYEVNFPLRKLPSSSFELRMRRIEPLRTAALEAIAAECL